MIKMTIAMPAPSLLNQMIRNQQDLGNIGDPRNQKDLRLASQQKEDPGIQDLHSFPHLTGQQQKHQTTCQTHQLHIQHLPTKLKGHLMLGLHGMPTYPFSQFTEMQ